MPRTARNATSLGVAPRVGFVSLGCPKALVDSERILTQLRAEGYATSSTYRGADLVIVNTCGFIDAAVEESLGAIEKLIRKRIDRVLVPGFEPDGATIAALMGRDAVPIRDVAPRRDVRTRNSAPAPRLVPAHATAPRQATAGPQRPADPIFSKPYEPGTATAAPAESAAVPSRQRQRPVAALLGGLKRAAG